jgi:hypothetical protein
MAQMRMHIKLKSKNLKGKYHLGTGLGIHGEIILNGIFSKIVMSVNWIHLAQDKFK